MNSTSESIRLAGRSVEHSRHVCAFFHNRDEEYGVLLPFVKEGYNRGEKGFHIVDPQYRVERLERLTAAGIDGNGRLDVVTWNEAYLRDGCFSQDAMLDLIQEVLEDGRKLGYARTRLWANMEWALQDFPGVEQLVEYEARLNNVLPKFDDDVVVCTYDLNRFGAGVAMDILRTHPLVIIGGLLQENPFYVPPEVFLAEVRRRNVENW